MSPMLRHLAALLAAGALLAPAGRAHAKALAAPTQVYAPVAATPLDARLDPALRSIVDRLHAAASGGAAVRPGAPRPADFFAAASPWQLADAGPGAMPEADVFVRLQPGAGTAGLLAAGGSVRVRRGELVLARMPITSIEPIAALPEVVSLSLSQRRPALLDSSRVRSGAAAVQAGTGGLSRAYAGTGVIVGVLDSGLDYTHPDFNTPANHTRVKSLLDFAQNGGTEFGPASLDARTCPEQDTHAGEGHGTHVTGIAAGNGRLNARYVGMAPQADLLFVKGFRNSPGFSDADVVTGVAWMFGKADSLGEAAAVNLSLGNQVGPHDGSSTYDQILSALTGPGRVIVVAAGNDGGSELHAGYTTSGSSYNDAPETAMVLSSNTPVVDLWAPAGTNVSVGLAAYDPSTLQAPLTGNPVPVWVSNAAAPGQLVQGTATSGTTGLADFAIDARTLADANNGAHEVVIQLAPHAGSAVVPANLVWTVFTFGSGHFDTWLTGGQFPSVAPVGYQWPSYFFQGNTSLTVGEPGCARRVLCVGSHVTKRFWTDSTGTVQSNDGWYPKPATLDSVSFFSSRGPSRDGRVLPDFTAPGDVIISALSKDCGAVTAQVVQGGGYQAMQGTSMATPHVTGIVALMLQRDPYLTPENVRAILKQTAIATDAPVPSNAYGAGRVNALAAELATPDPLGCVTALPSGRLVPCSQLAGEPLSIMAYPTPAPRQVRLAYVLPVAQRVHLALYDVSGRRVRTLVDGPVPAGVQDAPWRGEDDHGGAVPPGVYFARLITATGSRTARIVLSR